MLAGTTVCSLWAKEGKDTKEILKNVFMIVQLEKIEFSRLKIAGYPML